MAYRYSSSANLQLLVDYLRIQVSRLEAEQTARRFVITENTDEENEYRVSGFPGPNPTIYLLAGLTYCFDIRTEDPLVITEYDNDENYVSEGMTYYNDLTQIKLTDIDANDGKKEGLLYWTVPPEVSADFKYQNPSNPAMFGKIRVKSMYHINPIEPLP